MQQTQIVLVICTFEGYSVVFDNVVFDLGTHDYYSAQALRAM